MFKLHAAYTCACGMRTMHVQCHVPACLSTACSVISAVRLQVVGRTSPRVVCTTLTPAPIVQMFWPDDKKWYLIQIDSVDPRSRKAQCVSVISPDPEHQSRLSDALCKPACGSSQCCDPMA